MTMSEGHVKKIAIKDWESEEDEHTRIQTHKSTPAQMQKVQTFTETDTHTHTPGAMKD